MKTEKAVYVTRPSLPPLQDYCEFLKKIWESKYITNNGPLLQEFEKKLSEYLKVKYISVVSNGTLALLIALKALEVGGEVITSPFSFIATTNAIRWCGLKPVFADIEKDGYNLDPNSIEAAITVNTSAILPIHVYGNPCNVKKITDIAARHGLKVLYDAAHCYGVNHGTKSIIEFGDMSILSFHATKTFNTIEGGAIVSRTAQMKAKVDQLRNFGYDDNGEVQVSGINAKLNELQAAYGLLQLRDVNKHIFGRKKIDEMYRRELASVPGIKLLNIKGEVKHNYTYFPIQVEEETYGVSRDVIYERLKSKGVYSRKYFFPLISNTGEYKDLPSAAIDNLPVANDVAEQVLCLPIYDGLTIMEQRRIINTLKGK